MQALHGPDPLCAESWRMDTSESGRIPAQLRGIVGADDSPVSGERMPDRQKQPAAVDSRAV